MNKQHNKNSVGIYEIQKTIHNLKIKNRRYPNQLFIRNTTTIPQTVVRHQTYHQGPLTKRRQNNSCPNFYEHKKQLGRTRSHFAEGMSFGRKTRRLIKKAKLKLEIFNTGAQVFRHLRLTFNPQWRLDTDGGPHGQYEFEYDMYNVWYCKVHNIGASNFHIILYQK